MSADGKKDDKDCGYYFKWTDPSARKPPLPCPPCKNVTHPLRYYEFTQDEIKALEECDKESFYQRCVPFSTLFASLTYAAIKYGVLAGSRHYGAVPKVVFAVVLGHICGRLSYLSKCDEKLRDISEDSKLTKLMRKYHMEAHPELYEKKK